MARYKLIILTITTLIVGFLGGFLIGSKYGFEPEPQGITPAPKIAKADEKEFGKPALVYFFAKDCSSCNKFKPNWLYLKKKYSDKFNFIEIDVDKQVNAPLCMEFMVNIIPAVHIEDARFRNRSFINPMEYHFMPRFQDELNRYLQMREVLKKGVTETPEV